MTRTNNNINQLMNLLMAIRKINYQALLELNPNNNNRNKKAK